MPIDATGTLYTWVRDSAAAHPDQPALEVAGHQLGYAELIDLADRLATRLVDAVGRPPHAVGLLAARSLAAYAGYLAALRCGATVVPLNPKFPAARNQSMCRLSGVDAVIFDDTGAAQAGAVLAGTAMAPVPLTGVWHAQLPTAPWDGPVTADPDAVAYTLFTSGSTGIPKGVPIRHRNVGPYLRHCVERYGVGPGSRLSQAFELTFDPSVFDMFVAWSAGAALVVPQADEVLNPARFVVRERISHWYSVPSVVSLARRLRALPPGCMPGLRWSLFAGEQLSLAQARTWAEAAPASTIENIYGPTELTITCVGYRLPADPGAWPRTSNGTVPIGAVYPHLEGILLDEHGVATDDGELCVRGPQRFDGYVDPADDTGRFVSYAAGGRATDTAPGPDSWYRTGDRVRVEDGALVHLGRLDDQIKISGYRVELGEIESALRRHPGVADLVVLAVPGAAGTVELHAVHTGEEVPHTEFAGLLADLPEYMRPQWFHHRDALPTNLNGKTDRRRLTAELLEPAAAAG
ncbi:MAG TPA: amino acid adenylation domain-containing protein [Actinophytocola sp.]|uniref:amino acid adenylation domain-containing protein n=1 Tax=Actinophytocola sp. TaxID=1872138 RepID=UPI002DBB250F|nr:amino acid adenylation domain-containing protein [Actinophytocola sp.]HEU5471335.1 amino acid adenylation domain-containing protein [Actinophytocola sp.]